jgi:predicted DNA-binding transcriptional regulator AlpA
MEQFKHDGETLEKEVRDSKLTITEVTRRLKVNRKTIYNWYTKDELPSSIALKVGEVIEVDLVKKYPLQFSDDKPYHVGAKKKTNTVNESDVIYWKDKYYAELEKNNQLLKEKVELLEKINVNNR